MTKTFIDLFAGCGGLSLGLIASGEWKGLFAIEKDPDAFETLRHNLIEGQNKYCFEWPVWLPKKPYQIQNVLNEKHSMLKRLKGKVDLIAGGPPCQGFSMAGKRNGIDPRNHLVKKYLQFVNLIQPKYVLIENVVGITIGHTRTIKHGKTLYKESRKPYSKYIEEKLNEIGYEVFPETLHSINYGIPQNRKRHIFIGIRNDLVTEDMIEGLQKLRENVRFKFLGKKGFNGELISVKQAISDLSLNKKELLACSDSPGFCQIRYGKPRTHYQKLLHRDQNGRSLNGHAPNSLRLANHRPETLEKFKKIHRYCKTSGRKGVCLSEAERKKLDIRKNVFVVLNENNPSHTITTLPDDILHYKDPRILTVRENARIQSFPDWFEFKGKYTTGGVNRVKECPRYTQVGNAVPPFLSEFLGMLLTEIDRGTSL